MTPMSADFDNDPEFHAATAKPSPRRRLSLLNVLVALAAVLLLIGLLLPAVRTAGPSARRIQCVNNLKQIALALHNYEETYKVFPPAYTVDASGRPLHSWRTLILPFLEQQALYQTIDLSKPWDDPANAKARETLVPSFRCPSAQELPNTTTYLAVVAPGSCLTPGKARRLADVTDGTASTLMVIEVGRENAVPWMAPVDAGESLVMGLGPASKHHHPGGSNACFVDGSVHFLKATTPADVRRALISIAGNEHLSADSW
jgi:prepilin-type processing-associated H-X9-DG protein